MSKIEYRVRPVTRYVVTRFEQEGERSALETIGEYPNESYANRVKDALAVADPGGDELPSHPPPKE